MQGVYENNWNQLKLHYDSLKPLGRLGRWHSLLILERRVANCLVQANYNTNLYDILHRFIAYYCDILRLFRSVLLAWKLRSLIRSIQLTSTAYAHSPTCRNPHGTGDTTLTEGDRSLIVTHSAEDLSLSQSQSLHAWPPHCTLFAVCSRLSAWLVGR